jgi:hypothetical protein
MAFFGCLLVLQRYIFCLDLVVVPRVLVIVLLYRHSVPRIMFHRVSTLSLHSIVYTLIFDCSLAHIFVALILFARSISLSIVHVMSLHSLKLVWRHRDMCGPKGPKYAWHMRSKAPCWCKKYPAVAGYLIKEGPFS